MAAGGAGRRIVSAVETAFYHGFAWEPYRTERAIPPFVWPIHVNRFAEDESPVHRGNGSARPAKRGLKPRINRFAFKGEHAKDTFVDATERFAGHETFQPLDAKGKFARSQRSLGGNTTGTQPLEIGR